MPCWEIKIFDEDDNELPADREGEIVARGPVMTGYHNQPEATARALRHGWLHTGDIGRIDKNGFLFVTARRRRVLILKGQNIFPEDIEAVLAGHQAVAAVKIIGVPGVLAVLESGKQKTEYRTLENQLDSPNLPFIRSPPAISVCNKRQSTGW